MSNLHKIDETEEVSETGQVNGNKEALKSNSNDGSLKAIKSNSTDGSSKAEGSKTQRPTRRLYFRNISYKTTEDDLKKFYQEKAGDVESVEIFKDDKSNPRGCGIIIFKNFEGAQKAIQNFNQHEFKGRKIFLQEDFGVKRDKYGFIRNGNRIMKLKEKFEKLVSSGSDDDLYGLSKEFLLSLGIDGPLNNRVFIANLNFRVSEKQLKNTFKLAGKVLSVKILTDDEGNSRGCGFIEFNHPLEAIQAISVFNAQLYCDRTINVCLANKSDHLNDFKLPDGLLTIGKGLGKNGTFIRNISQNINKIDPEILEKNSEILPSDEISPILTKHNPFHNNEKEK